MKKNIGIIDISIRLVIAILLLVLYFTNIISMTIGIILLIVSGIFIVTSLLGYCPLYLAFGFNTR
ncbi:MAG: YgaP family membrane protein, partial [Bacteroidales bacterium]